MSYKSKICLKEKMIPESFIKDAIGITYRRVKVTQLRAVNQHNNRLIFKSMTQTPHYIHAVQALNPTKTIKEDGIQTYNEFRKRATNGRESINQKFLNLIPVFNESNYDFDKRPILVIRHLFRPFHFTIVDGLHRAAILTAKDSTHILVLHIKSRKSFLNRFINFIKKKNCPII